MIVALLMCISANVNVMGLAATDGRGKAIGAAVRRILMISSIARMALSREKFTGGRMVISLETRVWKWG